MKRKKVLILGAAGRDFHNFNVFFKNKKEYEVVGFTSTQIPGIENRIYPKELAGRFYKKGIKIYDELKLEELIERKKVDVVVFSYSDVSYDHVMEIASKVLSKGSDFWLLGPKSTMVKSKKPVIAVTAVRTGSGKSSIVAKIAEILRKYGEVAIIRHPMPYGNLRVQDFQVFKSEKDLKDASIEEREEIEFHLRNGNEVITGFDMKKVLKYSEKKDFIIWDGGNNDFPFIKPSVWITVVDALRNYEPSYPGEICLKCADIIVINKSNMVKKEKIREIIRKIREKNKKAKIIRTNSVLNYEVEKIKLVKESNGKVIVIEDGPTTTHGGMKFGPGLIIARKHKLKVINAEKYAVGVFKDIYKNYRLKKIIPAIGYNKQQLKDLEKMINKIIKNEKPSLIVCSSQASLDKIMKIKIPFLKISYKVEEVNGSLEKEVLKRLKVGRIL